MHHAATEEIDHLAWCEQRLRELDSRPSLLNPLFYGASLAIGAAAGAIGDKVSLGFIAATEDQVCQHIENHLESLPTEEKKSRAILEQMLIDERHHGTAAIAAGGMRFPRWLKRAMTQVSGAMTKTTYYV
jgi:ubiquinone biosynthesis monooxygenase Coq7